MLSGSALISIMFVLNLLMPSMGYANEVKDSASNIHDAVSSSSLLEQDALSPSDPAVPEDPAAALGEGSPAEPAPEASGPAAQREGLVEEGGALYFYEGGRRVSGERQIDGSWLYSSMEKSTFRSAGFRHFAPERRHLP